VGRAPGPGRRARYATLVDQPEPEASRQRLASAGELARRRLITELDHLTAARFTALRSTVGTALDAITALISSSADPDAAPPSDAPRATDLATACAATNPDAADTTGTSVDTADTFALDVGRWLHPAAAASPAPAQ
jgi:hypothetical protein